MKNSPTVSRLLQETRDAHRAARACGFTLIELLVVIAIIAILASMLLPASDVERKKQSQPHQLHE